MQSLYSSLVYKVLWIYCYEKLIQTTLLTLIIANYHRIKLSCIYFANQSHVMNYKFFFVHWQHIIIFIKSSLHKQTESDILLHTCQNSFLKNWSNETYKLIFWRMWMKNIIHFGTKRFNEHYYECVGNIATFFNRSMPNYSQT